MSATTASKPERIVFIGLGKMGAPMARHLHAAGHRLIGVERNASRRAALADIGFAVHADLATALRAPSASDTAGGGSFAPSSRLLFSSLPDDAALTAVAEQIAAMDTAAVLAGCGWVDTSTVSVEASDAAIATAAARGMPSLCAPVSGNAPMAAAAQLSVLASGDRALFERCRPLFAAWGPKQVYTGVGSGARTAKLMINLMVATTSAMLAEAVALGRSGGLDSATVWSLIESSAVASPIVLAKAPALRAGNYSPTFTVEQMQKDMTLILEAAQAGGVDAPVAREVARSLDQAAAAGDGALDYAVVIRHALQRAAKR